MRNLLYAATALCAIGLATPANATLQISIGVGADVFTCKDGDACDTSPVGANNLLVVDTTVDGVNVEVTLAKATFGASNSLQLSAGSITNQNPGNVVVTLLASATGFTAPVTSINESASLTFNTNVGASDSTLRFWADALNTQGANPSNTPGTLLNTATGAAATDPDSFSGTATSAFAADQPFSMTEGGTLSLIAGGSITGFNESMTTHAAPEPASLALLGVGLLGLGFVANRKRSV